MTSNPSVGFEDIEFQVSYTHALKRSQIQQISVLRRESLAIDFAHRPSAEREVFVANAQRATGNPNRAVGSLLSREQSYGSALGVMAVQGDTLLAYIPSADNVSSTGKPGMKGLPIRLAKMNLKGSSFLTKGRPAIEARYFWMGYAALSETARGMVADSGAELSLLDVMIGLSAAPRLDAQPATVYPWQQEHVWKQSLRNVGYEPDMKEMGRLDAEGDSTAPAVETTNRFVFGKDAAPVQQELWRHTTGNLKRTIAEMAGEVSLSTLFRKFNVVDHGDALVGLDKLS